MGIIYEYRVRLVMCVCVQCPHSIYMHYKRTLGGRWNEMNVEPDDRRVANWQNVNVGLLNKRDDRIIYKES